MLVVGWLLDICSSSIQIDKTQINVCFEELRVNFSCQSHFYCDSITNNNTLWAHLYGLYVKHEVTTYTYQQLPLQWMRHYHKIWLPVAPKVFKYSNSKRNRVAVHTNTHSRNKKYFALITLWIICISLVFAHLFLLFLFFCMRVREALKPILLYISLSLIYLW